MRRLILTNHYATNSKAYAPRKTEESHEFSGLKVTRIQRLTQLEKTFEKPADFSLAGHFQGAFGVFQAKTKQKIQVEFTGWAATNVREMQWRPSQRIVKNDGKTVVATFELDNVIEFKRWALGFAEYARIISPNELVSDVQRSLQKALEKY